MDFKAFKMDGLGNDFVIIDNRQEITNLTKDQIVKICDRNFIGCDQLIFIESDNSANASLRFFNSDGGESGACGNGTRCVAALISKEKNNKSIILNTLSGKLKSQILDKKIVTTEIGNARLKWEEIPLSKEMNTKNLNIKIIDSNKNEYFGGIIAPGIKLSLNTLSDKATLIPKIELKKINKVIGNNTISAVRSGFFWGYAGLIDNIINLIKKETRKTFKVIITGGFSGLFKNSIKTKVSQNQDITIKGLIKISRLIK